MGTKGCNQGHVADRRGGGLVTKGERSKSRCGYRCRTCASLRKSEWIVHYAQLPAQTSCNGSTLTQIRQCARRRAQTPADDHVTPPLSRSLALALSICLLARIRLAPQTLTRKILRTCAMSSALGGEISQNLKKASADILYSASLRGYKYRWYLKKRGWRHYQHSNT
eukprot:6214128-Pleurochrysis_carterae.AAC.1